MKNGRCRFHGGRSTGPRTEQGKVTAEQSLEIAVKTAEKIEVDQSSPSHQAAEVVNDPNLVNQWRAAAYLWEYRYLNRYLVFHTQQFLDWLYDRTEPMNIEVAVALWIMKVPSVIERNAVIEALSQHHLITVKNNAITITLKGREYVDVRGCVAPAFPELNKLNE